MSFRKSPIKRSSWFKLIINILSNSAKESNDPSFIRMLVPKQLSNVSKNWNLKAFCTHLSHLVHSSFKLGPSFGVWISGWMIKLLLRTYEGLSFGFYAYFAEIQASLRDDSILYLSLEWARFLIFEYGQILDPGPTLSIKNLVDEDDVTRRTPKIYVSMDSLWTWIVWNATSNKFMDLGMWQKIKW